MPIKLNVKAQYNAAARQFPQLAKKLPSLTAQALNATASEARKHAIRAAASDVKLPQRLLQRRFTRGGSGKQARTWIASRASPHRLFATIAVYQRGIPYFQIMGAQTKAGIKLKTGKLWQGEHGVFKVPKGHYAGMAFRRTRPRPTTRAARKAGEGKGALVVDRLNVREALTKRFDEHVSGTRGRSIFTRQYIERIRRALARMGVQG